jgi:hypothetical protein
MVVQISSPEEVVERCFAQQEPELRRELTLLKESFPAIFQQSASFFCAAAKEGRATCNPPISYPEDLRVYRILVKYPCFDFYGAGSNYSLRRAWTRIKAVRRVFHWGKYPEPEMHCTAIEQMLFLCKYIERTHIKAPISSNNPLLQRLVALIEEYIN